MPHQSLVTNPRRGSKAVSVDDDVTGQLRLPIDPATTGEASPWSNDAGAYWQQRLEAIQQRHRLAVIKGDRG
jgi:hypothetical protein